MKIHIDTSTAEEQAKAQKVKGKTASSTSSKKPSSSSSAQGQSAQPGAGGPQQKPKPTKPLQKKPPNEPKAPQDVQAARQQQTAVLKARQNLETQGKNDGATRDVNVGAGFWPPYSL